MADEKQPELWHRQPTETDEEWHLFERFMELRTLRRVAREEWRGKKFDDTKMYLTSMSHLHRWTRRVTAYDRWMADVKDGAVEETIKSMLRVSKQKAVEILQDMTRRVEEAGQRVDDAIAADEMKEAEKPTEGGRPKLYLQTTRTLLQMQSLVLEAIDDFQKTNSTLKEAEQPFGDVLEGANDKLAAMVKRANRTLNEEAKQPPGMLQ